MSNSNPGGLDALLNAKSVAVLGASDRVGSWGWRVLDYLERYHFEGEIIPINPSRRIIGGRTSLASVSEYDGGPVDHAIVLLPADKAEAALRECADAGVRAASVISGGFGDDDIDAPARLRELVRASGMRVLGPNCLGSINAHRGLVASPSSALLTAELVPGPVSIVTQSGAVGAYILSALGDLRFGLRYYVSTGNEVDLQLGEILSFAAEDDLTQIIVAYVEGVRDPDTFVEGLERAHANGKTVVVLKGGRTKAGAAAVQSHTAALAGDSEVYDAVLARTGAVRADSLNDILDVVSSAIHPPRSAPVQRRAAVVTTSGGLGVLVSESLSDFGFTLPAPSAPVRERIAEILPLASTLNPFDLAGLGADNIDLLEEVLQLLVRSGDIDTLAMVMSNAARSPHVEPRMTAIIEKIAMEFSGSVVAVGHPPKKSKSLLEAASVVVVDDPCDVGRRVDVLSRIATSAARPVALAYRDRATEHRRVLSQVVATTRLREAGIPFPATVVVNDVEAAIATTLPFPVAVKLLEPEVVHKSERGFVRLGVNDTETLVRHVQELLDLRSENGQITVESMVERPLFELIVGAHIDETFGLVYTVGLGGYFAEFHRDLAIVMSPLTLETVTLSLHSMSSWDGFLSGFRGEAGVEPQSVLAILEGIARAFDEYADLVEVEVNPVIVTSNALIAVDAAAWEREGGESTITPIKTENAP